jgi:hypothetical protein
MRGYPRRVSSSRGPRARLALSGGAIEAFLERLVVPPVHDASSVERRDDFRRVVGLVAACAVGFFGPSLLLANVPQSAWLPYLVAAAEAGLFVGGSFIVIGPGSCCAVPAAICNALVLAGLASLYHSYYHQLGLLFVLIVAAHAIVHGLRPALTSALLGSLLVPFVVQAGQPINLSDPIYAFIYLAGAALLPWTAGRLARRRLLALRQQLALTVAIEREAVLILARAAEAKDQVTGDHVVRVGDMAAQLGRRSGMSDAESEDLRFAGMLHDVGKLHLPDRLLAKPGPLDRDEWAIVKMHTVWGEKILGSTEGFELARLICRSHHENWDGSGYPDGLVGARIPIAARIVRLADVLDALRNQRPYKAAWPVERCLEEISRGAGTIFDPELTRELIDLLRAGAPAQSSLGHPVRSSGQLKSLHDRAVAT